VSLGNPNSGISPALYPYRHCNRLAFLRILDLFQPGNLSPMNLNDLRKRVNRLDQLSRGLAKEILLWKACNEPLPFDVAESSGREHREADRAVPAEVPVKLLFETPDRTPRAGTFRPGCLEVAAYLPTPPFCVGVAGECLAEDAETGGRSRQLLFRPLELDYRLEQSDPVVK
jgi:hypothetical protein